MIASLICASSGLGVLCPLLAVKPELPRNALSVRQLLKGNGVQLVSHNQYERVMLIARNLPKIRSWLAEDLKLPGLCREKVLATVVKLLEISLIRIGKRGVFSGQSVVLV
jgi:hypothetical protein